MTHEVCVWEGRIGDTDGVLGEVIVMLIISLLVSVVPYNFGSFIN